MALNVPDVSISCEEGMCPSFLNGLIFRCAILLQVETFAIIENIIEWTTKYGIENFYPFLTIISLQFILKNYLYKTIVKQL